MFEIGVNAGAAGMGSKSELLFELAKPMVVKRRDSDALLVPPTPLGEIVISAKYVVFALRPEHSYT